MVEKRIFVVVAHTVDTPTGIVVQVPGRMAAQGGHALSRMKMHRLLDDIERTYRIANKIAKKLGDKTEVIGNWRKIADRKITTIWLACRDSQELQHIADNLDRVGVGYYDFEDENDNLYGVGWHPRTALAAVPAAPERLEGITDYLPLWTPEKTNV
jgi:peptidyl-tRNA hydrolase